MIFLGNLINQINSEEVYSLSVFRSGYLHFTFNEYLKFKNTFSKNTYVV